MLCCAVQEIDGISNHSPIESLKQIYDERRNDRMGKGAFLIFTARAEKEYTYGIEFKNAIVENKLGNIIESNAMHNPRFEGENHKIIVYIWEVSQENYDEWYKKNAPDVQKMQPVEIEW